MPFTTKASDVWDENQQAVSLCDWRVAEGIRKQGKSDTRHM